MLWQRTTLCIAALFFCVVAAGGSAPVLAQTANFHPCNSQPSLPICEYGYGKRIAVARWGAKPEPRDPDAAANVSLVTSNPAKEIKKLKSSTILVMDVDTSEVLFARDEDAVRPVASITKLMMGMVIVAAKQPMDEMISIKASDVRSSSDLPSRLATGSSLSRKDLLHLALASSENSAAQALARTYPGGIEAFVEAMNAQALALGMTDSQFVGPTGLSNDNVSSARDLVKLLHAASKQPLIRKFSTDASHKAVGKAFRNTNVLVGRPHWEILASKTGTTRKAGACLVMMLRLEGRNLAMVLLNAKGASGTRFGDAVRLRRILNSQLAMK